MAYQKKYYYQFVPDGKTETHIVEFWQDTSENLVSEEIKGGLPPFLIEFPELNHKFQVVRGTGATISILSATDMKFFAGLQHTNPTEFKVLYYIDGVLNWSGYLNSDMQSEPYNINFNYIVTTTANDGFSLMDRFRFIQSDGTNYIGLKSIWELLQICLNKIALPYVDIRVKLATTFAGFSAAADKTILHELFVDCANFYDEDNLAMTLREVIEAILAPYGAFICQSGGSIYITDIHTLAGGGTITYQKFNASTYAYVSIVNVVTEKSIASIGYLGTGQSIDRSGGTNRQVVVYSPYPTKEITNETIVRTDEFTIVPETFNTKDGYYYKTLEAHYLWQTHLAATFEESAKSTSEDDERTVYFRMPMLTNNEPVLSLINANSFNLNVLSRNYKWYKSISTRTTRRRYLDGLAFLITCDILTKSKNNPYNESESGQEIPLLGLNLELSIGGYYYNENTKQWQQSFYSGSVFYTSDNSQSISDRWVKNGGNGSGWLIPVGNIDQTLVYNGYFGFKIWSNTTILRKGQGILTNSSFLKEVWIKNLNIKLVNLDGSEIEDSDNQYVGLLNPEFAQTGEEIQLKLGTCSRYSDRGKLMYLDGSDYRVVEEFTRDSQTFIIEYLLLNSLCSNYQANFITLNAMKLKNSFGLINVLTDSTFLGTSKLMVKSAVINPADNIIECDLVEIAEDSLTIEENINVFYGD